MNKRKTPHKARLCWELGIAGFYVAGKGKSSTKAVPCPGADRIDNCPPSPSTAQRTTSRLALQQSLVKMSLQMQLQRELLMRKASMVDRQLDTLLPPASRLTYEPSNGRSTERRGASTYVKA